MNTRFGSLVRTSLASLAFVVAAGAFAASTHAQAGRKVAEVAIPFGFQNGSTHLEPGTYTLYTPNEGFLAVRDQRGATVTLFLTNPHDTTKPANLTRVVFHKYGDFYFLREVWTAGSTTHLQCPKSNGEKALQRERRLASTTEPPNGTEVALLELPN